MGASRQRTDDVIWAAGFFDGEGSIVISKRKNKRVIKEDYEYYVAVIHVSQVHRAPLEKFVELFGGSLVLDNRTPDSPSRPIWRWTVSARLAGDALWELAPYLKLKQRQARIALSFQSRRGSGVFPDQDYEDHLAIKALNVRGKA